jgi:HEAT repeat protein
MGTVLSASTSDRHPDDPVERAVATVAAGAQRPLPSATVRWLAELVAHDPDSRVRAAALGSLARAGGAEAAWVAAMADAEPSVRRRACELAPAIRPPAPAPLVSALTDGDPGVAEAAAWALGELGGTAVEQAAVTGLSAAAGTHPDPLVREAAVAALGSLGHPDGLPAVLAACQDRPTIRRRAVVALAAFDGPEVESTLERALSDRDWQVRQVAEDLAGPRSQVEGSGPG